MYNPAKPYKHNILKIIQSTWKTPYLNVRPGIYPTFTLKTKLPQVDHTDGIGTKGYIHWRQKTFKEAVIDVLAMNLNDLALVRAHPIKLQNHIILPTDDHKVILEIVKDTAKECKKRQIAMTGGETSIHEGTDSMDISMTVSGIIKNPQPNMCKVGDVLVGFASNGLHSNGFTTVRKHYKTLSNPEFTKPTAIYLNEILRLDKEINIHGMMHITGGAFTKLKDILGKTDAFIYRGHKLKPQPIFKSLYRKGISDREMYSTFNCGIGFVISISPDDLPKLKSKFKTDVVGEIKKGDGKVIVESMFSNSKVFY